MAGLLAFLMVLPAEHLLASYCPMAADERQQQDSDCCPYTSREAGSSEDANTGNSHSGRSGDAHGGHSDCDPCTDCFCALVPYSGTGDQASRDATVSLSLSEMPTVTRGIAYILPETVERPVLPRKPLPEPVPLYLANQVLLN